MTWVRSAKGSNIPEKMSSETNLFLRKMSSDQMWIDNRQVFLLSVVWSPSNNLVSSHRYRTGNLHHRLLFYQNQNVCVSFAFPHPTFILTTNLYQGEEQSSSVWEVREWVGKFVKESSDEKSLAKSPNFDCKIYTQCQ